MLPGAISAGVIAATAMMDYMEPGLAGSLTLLAAGVGAVAAWGIAKLIIEGHYYRRKASARALLEESALPIQIADEVYLESLLDSLRKESLSIAGGQPRGRKVEDRLFDAAALLHLLDNSSASLERRTQKRIGFSRQTLWLARSDVGGALPVLLSCLNCAPCCMVNPLPALGIVMWLRNAEIKAYVSAICDYFVVHLSEPDERAAPAPGLLREIEARGYDYRLRARKDRDRGPLG